MGLFGRLWGAKRDAAPTLASSTPVPMHWRDGISTPIPDWRALWHAQSADGERHAYWSQVAAQWLEALASHLGSGYSVRRSENFLLLGSLTARDASLTLEACERTRQRILRALPGVAQASGEGPHVVLIFDTHEAYYDYVDNYYDEPGEYAQSSGMFLQHGYGHFVFARDHVAMMEPIIAHELTHCLVMHLPLPAWLNEGIAVSMEKKLHPHYEDSRHAGRALREIAAKRAAFWNDETIQAFWSGKTFLRADEGNALSYDLGEHLARLLSRDYAAFATFVAAANRADGGFGAAHEHLGIDLGDCAAAILGDGNWRPRPEQWLDGTERGQFAPESK